MKVKFGTAIHRTQGIMDYIHMGVWGPIKTTSLDGEHYFVSFVNDYSRRNWVYTIRSKDGSLGFCGVGKEDGIAYR